MHQPLDRAHGVVADRIVALGGIADELTGVRHELTRDRVARVFRPDEGGQRRRKADCVALGDGLEAGKPFGRDQPRFDEILGSAQPSRRSLGDHGRSSRQSRAQINAPAGADGGGRTRTALRPRDFKSLASTGFATSAAIISISYASSVISPEAGPCPPGKSELIALRDRNRLMGTEDDALREE